MTLQVFPESIISSFSIPLKDRFDVISSDFEGKNQQRQPVSRFQDLREITIPYNIVTETDWPTLRNFFRKRRGGLYPFWIFAKKQRLLEDEEVGRGGPFPIDWAIADDGGSYTHETLEARDDTADDMILLPAVPAVNDRYWFGSKIKSDKLIVTISTPGVGTWTIAWKYWNGSALAALSGVSDGTIGFTAAAGDREVTFTMPSDWVDHEVDGVNQYWICAEVTAYTSITTQPKGTKATYNTKTYDLPSKSTVNDATLITYVNDVITAKTFVSGGGGGGADRVTFSGYQSQGALITADFTGLLRIKGVITSDFIDDWFRDRHSRMNFVIKEVP